MGTRGRSLGVTLFSKEDYKETELVVLVMMMMMLDGYLCHDDDTFVHTPY